MAHGNLDAIHRERVDLIIKRAMKNGEFDPKDLFLSEKVAETIDQEKTLLGSYNEDRLMGLLPFTPTVYVRICPVCAERMNFDRFKKFVTSGNVIPVLISKFEDYPDELNDFVLRHNHISPWEYRGFRYLRLTHEEQLCLCSGCASKMFNQMKDQAAGRRNGQQYAGHIQLIRQNIHPFLNPDARLIDAAAVACARRKLGDLRRLATMSFAVHELRTAQAFDAHIVLAEEELRSIPDDISAKLDEALLVSAQIRLKVAEGLSLKIPTEISLDTFLEIVTDYQPRVTKVVDEVVGAAPSKSSVDLSREIIAINTEIERIKGLKRHTFLEAAIGVSKQNSSLIYAALIGAALGTVNTVLGCIGGPAAGAKKFAQKKGLVPEVAAAKRLGRQIVAATQPYTDELLRLYLGANKPAIRVLSLQKRLQSQANRAKAA